MKRILFALVITALANVASAEIYKCTAADGSKVYSQQPCGADAETVVIKNHTAGVTMVGEGDFTKVDAANRSRDIDRAIDQRYRTIDSLQRTRDAKVAGIRRQQRMANNNLAGATYLQSLATEMQAINEDYNSRISNERDAIRNLNEQR